MAKAKWNENAAIRSAIRRTFSRSPIVREVMHKVRREVPKFNKDGSRAKKDAVQYQCGVCGTWTKSTAIAVDHKEPVISVEEGFKDWNTFVERLFCDADNLQVICDDCHDAKTYEERSERQSKVEAERLDKMILQKEFTGDDQKFLKRVAKKTGPHFDSNASIARDLLGRYFPKKKGKT